MRAGDLDRRIGRDALSRAIDDFDDPKLTISFTTCSADAEPFEVRRPGHARRTLGFIEQQSHGNTIIIHEVRIVKP